MTDEEIAALADGMAPFVRECVAEAFTISPELAQQVADAIRLLHESPSIPEVQRATPRPIQRIARIERDEEGNWVPVYQ